MTEQQDMSEDGDFRMQEVLNFLNSIEGAGYGGMATFEIARMNVRDALMRGVAQGSPEPSIQDVGYNPSTSDIRWAVNVLLEKIAAKFEGWDTMDLWRSDAAATVRGFKHDLTLSTVSSTTRRDPILHDERFPSASSVTST